MYKYTLLNASLDNLTQPEIEKTKEAVRSEIAPRLQKTICQGDSMKPLRERGVEFKYLYFDSSGNEITKVSINSDQCQ